MNLKFDGIDLSDEVKDSLNSQVQELIESEVKGLKGKNSELLAKVDEYRGTRDEVKTLKQQLEDMQLTEKEREAKAKERAKKEAEEEKLNLQRERDEAVSERDNYIIASELTNALSKVNVSSELLDGAKAIIRSSQEIKVDNGKAVVGETPLNEFINKWAESDGSAYVAKSQNSGGNAQGANNGSSAKAEVSGKDRIAKGLQKSK